ncbi:MAG: hypothetical protein CMB88_00755 [Flammeovirgaceae bacterium]|nr:hypothetical protein [Flammeovirgaceae bacterium]
MILKSIVSVLCILAVIYGIVVKSRKYFNIGYFVFGIFIVFDQLTLFASSNDIIHLALAALWSTQVVLTIPNNLPPLTRDGSVIAKTAVPKIMLSLSIINFFGAYYVTLVDYIPFEAMYGHILLGIFPLAPAYFILFDKIEIVDK